MHLSSNLKSHIFILISETGKEKRVTLEENTMVLSLLSFFSNSGLREDFSPFSANFHRAIGDYYEIPSDFPLAGFMRRIQNTKQYLYCNVFWVSQYIWLLILQSFLLFDVLFESK